MTISDILQLISIICSSVLAIVAIVISIITLRQNRNMIFESNKPQITIFSKAISFTSPKKRLYLVLKNFGLSGATIVDIEYDKSFDKYFARPPFENISNVFIAPNQTFLYPLSLTRTAKEVFKIATTFKIKYLYLNKEYIESCTVTFSQYKDSCFLKVHSSKNLKELSEVLQEMTLQQL